MKHLLLAAAGLAIALFTGQAQAALTCTSTIDLGDSGGTVPGPVILTPGTCIHAGDKTFGNATSTGPGDASVTFTPASHFGNVTIGAAGAVTADANFSYEVVVDAAAAALGWRIEDLTKDFSLNQATTPGVTATGTLSAPAFGISCTRHDPADPADDCPVHTTFAPVTDLVIAETLTVGANTVVTVLTDTISQVQLVPEPASLGLLGTGLIGLGLLARRRRR